MYSNLAATGFIIGGAGLTYSGYTSLSSKQNEESSQKWAYLKIAVGSAAIVGGIALLYIQETPFKEYAEGIQKIPLCEKGTFQANSSLCSPGVYHPKLSSLAGSRRHEVELITMLDRFTSVPLKGLSRSLHNSKNIAIIKAENVKQLREADALAMKMFSKFLDPYRAHGITEENAVAWVDNPAPNTLSSDEWVERLKHLKFKSPYCFNIADLSPLQTFRAKPSFGHMQKTIEFCVACVAQNKFVSKSNQVVQGLFRSITLDTKNRYTPPAITAIHELMHVQELCDPTFETSEKNSWVRESLTTLKTLILQDEIHKKIHNIPMDTEIDYGEGRFAEVLLDKPTILGGKLYNYFNSRKIDIGEIANVYRNLEAKYSNLAEALVSRESFDFLNNECKSDLPNIHEYPFPEEMIMLDEQLEIFGFGT